MPRLGENCVRIGRGIAARVVASDPYAAYTVYDNCNDDDNVDLEDHTPDKGGPWEDGTDWIEIISNQADQVQNKQPGYYSIAGKADAFTVGLKITCGNVFHQFGPIANFTDGSNYVHVRQIDNSGTFNQIHATNHFASTYASAAYTHSAGDVYTIEVDGSNYTAKVNGVTKMTWSTSDDQGSGKQGVAAYDSTRAITFDEFYVQ